MKLCSSNTKKFLIFSQKKAFLKLLETKPCTSQSKLENKKNQPPEIFLCSNIKEFRIFSQKKAVLISEKFFMFIKFI